MALDTVLKQLEARIEELLKDHTAAVATTAELEQRVAELEGELAGRGEAAEQVAALESQRDELASRLQKVLELIDATLEPEA